MSLWNAKSVDPEMVTEADIADVCAELGIDTSADVANDFFQPGNAYHRGDRFRCVAVGICDGSFPVAVGFLPINVGGEATWKFAAMTTFEWRRGWKKRGS